MLDFNTLDVKYRILLFVDIVMILMARTSPMWAFLAAVGESTRCFWHFSGAFTSVGYVLCNIWIDGSRLYGAVFSAVSRQNPSEYRN